MFVNGVVSQLTSVPDWWVVGNTEKTVTFQDAELIINAQPGRVGIQLNEQDTSRQWGAGLDFKDAWGHTQLSLYSQWYPLDSTRREAVLEMYAHNNADGSFTNGGLQLYGGGNIGAQSDSSVAYPIFWVDGDTNKRIFVLRKAGGVVFGGEGSAMPDGDLSNGGFGLWLDPTNGATKLMIKAKSTNGTVVTGSISLA